MTLDKKLRRIEEERAVPQGSMRSQYGGYKPNFGVSRKARKARKWAQPRAAALGIDTIEGIDLIEGSRERLLFLFWDGGEGCFFSFGRSLSVLCE